MQSEAGTGKMSHGIKCSINLNAESWSHSTQPQTIETPSCYHSLSAFESIIVRLPLTPQLVFLMKVRLSRRAEAGTISPPPVAKYRRFVCTETNCNLRLRPHFQRIWRWENVLKPEPSVFHHIRNPSYIHWCYKAAKFALFLNQEAKGFILLVDFPCIKLSSTNNQSWPTETYHWLTHPFLVL